MNEEQENINVEMGQKKPSRISEILKRKQVSNTTLVILLIVAWICGFIWRGIYL